MACGPSVGILVCSIDGLCRIGLPLKVIVLLLSYDIMFNIRLCFSSS